MSDLGLALLGSGVVVPTPPPMRAVMARAEAAGLRDCGMGGEEHAVQTRTHAQRATCNIRRATCNIRVQSATYAVQRATYVVQRAT